MSVATLSAQEVAQLAGVDFAGRQCITHVSAPDQAGVGALVFAERAEVLEVALASAASLILIPLSLPVPASQREARLLAVSHPKLLFASCAQRLRLSQQAYVHPSASVAVDARIGQGVSIGAGAVVESGAILGNDVSLGSRAVVCAGVVLGNRVVVQPGAVLGSIGFGYVRDPATGEYILFPQQGTLVVEDDVEIGANSTVDRGALGETRIGAGTKIDNLVHIGHNCVIGRNVVIAAQTGLSGSCVIEDGAVIAGQVGLGDHCRIGAGVLLGGQAGVYPGKTVSGAGQIFTGTPAEPVRDHLRSLARLRRKG